MILCQQPLFTSIFLFSIFHYVSQFITILVLVPCRYMYLLLNTKYYNYFDEFVCAFFAVIVKIIFVHIIFEEFCMYFDRIFRDLTTWIEIEMKIVIVHRCRHCSCCDYSFARCITVTANTHRYRYLHDESIINLHVLHVLFVRCIIIC